MHTYDYGIWWLTILPTGPITATEVFPLRSSIPFRERIMQARLERLLSSETAARYYAEMFTGLG